MSDWAFKTMLEYRADLAACERVLDRQPLMFAILPGRLEAVSMHLADPRVDINKGDNNGRTPLMLAAMKDCTEAALLLLQDLRIDPNLQDVEGCTLLHRVVEKENNGIIRLLLEHDDVNPNLHEDGWLETPIHWAGQKGHLEALALLMADPRTHIQREDALH